MYFHVYRLCSVQLQWWFQIMDWLERYHFIQWDSQHPGGKIISSQTVKLINITFWGKGSSCFTLFCVFQPGSEDCGDVSSVLGAALISSTLRLRDACGEISPDCSGKPKTQIPRRGWERFAAQSSHGCQHGQVPRAGFTTVSGV